MVTTTATPSTADLIEQIKAEQTPNPMAQKCTAGRTLAQMNPVQRQAIADAYNQGLQFVAMSRWIFKQTGVKIGPKTLTRHLRGECTCL